MPRLTRQRAHLKKHNPNSHEHKTQWKNKEQDTNIQSTDESSEEGSVFWCTDELEDNEEQTLKLLMHGAKRIIPSKRPLCYLGNSARTKRRRKAQEKKIVAEHKKKITDFFNVTPIEDSESDVTSENENPLEPGQVSEDEAIDSEEDDQWSDVDENLDDELVKEIENKVLENKLPAGLKWKLVAILQYLRLSKFNKSKIHASLSVARQLGRGIYLARSIRKWAKILKAGGTLPESFRGKHPKIKSLLEDEDIQAEIVSYLRENKFEFYVADFVNHVSNVIFPKLGIERANKIG